MPVTAAPLARLPGVDLLATSGRLDAFLASVEKRAFRMAQIATQDRDDALDLVQDAMLQLARHYAGRAEAEWPPLFYRILENRIRDWQRAQTVRRRLFFWRQPLDAESDDEDPIDNLPDAGADTLAGLQRQQSMEVLEGALRALPARQRQAFELRIWQGLSVDETAAAMGCSDGSVKTHLSRALHSLRAQLEGVWP